MPTLKINENRKHLARSIIFQEIDLYLNCSNFSTVINKLNTVDNKRSRETNSIQGHLLK